jgi:hypothetical protein
VLNHASDYSQLTQDQFSSLGRVIVESSNIEYLLEIIMIRLARAPDYPALAITSQLGYVQKLNALKVLVDTHRRRYGSSLISDDMLDRLSSLLKEVDSFRMDRNRCAHYLWCRTTDETVFGIRFTGKHGDARKHNQDCMTFTVDELNSIASEMHRIVDDLLAVLTSLPEIEE